MSSLFPGMDPYLESPDWFPDLHGSLIIFLKASLQNRLPESYYAQSSQRVWLEYTRRYVEPDVEVVKRPRRARRESRGGIAVAERRAADPLVLTVETVEHGPFKESFLEIRRRKGKEIQLVTSIEVLSPANKAPGNPGRDKYLEEQREVLNSPIHLVEIDLLRGGTHTSALPRELVRSKAGPFDYHVSIHRFDRPQEFVFYPILLDEVLPTISIPLLPGDADVALDLPAAFDKAYDAGPYRREIEYGKDRIVPALKPEQAKWASTQTKKKHPGS
jgi:hypothetical protein